MVLRLTITEPLVFDKPPFLQLMSGVVFQPVYSTSPVIWRAVDMRTAI